MRRPYVRSGARCRTNRFGQNRRSDCKHTHTHTLRRGRSVPVDERARTQRVTSTNLLNDTGLISAPILTGPGDSFSILGRIVYVYV